MIICYLWFTVTLALALYTALLLHFFFIADINDFLYQVAE